MEAASKVEGIIEVPAGASDAVNTERQKAVEARLKAINDKRLNELAKRQEAESEDKVAEEDWKVIDE